MDLVFVRRRGSDRLVGARILVAEGGEQIMETALAKNVGRISPAPAARSEQRTLCAAAMQYPRSMRST